MKTIIILLLLCCCASCKVQQHATRQSDAHTESKHLMVYDTTHVTLVTSIRDTNHSAMKHHATEKITEQYDAETGKLKQRITERERDVTLLQTQIRALQERFDSLAAARVDTLAETTDLHTEDESHKESESKTPWTGIIAAAILGAIFAGWLLWKAYKFL